MTTTWIVTATPQVSALLEAAKARGGEVVVVIAGTDVPAPAGADRVVVVDGGADVPAEALAGAVAQTVEAQPGDVVLAGTAASDRVLAGAVAAKLGAPVLRGVTSVDAGSAQVSRYGGLVAATVSLAQPVVLLLDGGSAAEDGGQAETVTATPAPARVEGTQPATEKQVDLGAAKRIVAVGRGFRAEADLQLARDLAAALGAELACSRPIAEGNDWMPRETYIGVSGKHVAPELYVALGISGQLQHTAGMTGTRTVVAVNTDEKAPIFDHADYGIVGDLYQVLPALTAALKG